MLLAAPFVDIGIRGVFLFWCICRSDKRFCSGNKASAYIVTMCVICQNSVAGQIRKIERSSRGTCCCALSEYEQFRWYYMKNICDVYMNHLQNHLLLINSVAGILLKDKCWRTKDVIVPKENVFCCVSSKGMRLKTRKDRIVLEREPRDYICVLRHFKEEVVG